MPRPSSPPFFSTFRAIQDKLINLDPLSTCSSRNIRHKERSSIMLFCTACLAVPIRSSANTLYFFYDVASFQPVVARRYYCWNTDNTRSHCFTRVMRAFDQLVPFANVALFLKRKLTFKNLNKPHKTQTHTLCGTSLGLLGFHPQDYQ